LPASLDEFANRETALDVTAALRELPYEQRVALVLVDIEGYPVAEVGRILELPIGTVKSRCARGRARLAERLGHLRPDIGGNPPPGTGVPWRKDAQEVTPEP
ncbi:MAG TPA: sigma factor-like helix-turn-helix DNA-binding protein, partial [Mycobacteriales bacterium]|nr:sigma factor-like helix-turn-helix DNA-binding protein [Mycobacteriales bacterium]